MRIVVDTLCLTSTLSLLAPSFRGRVETVHYFERSKGLGWLYLLLLQTILGCRAEPVAFSMGEERNSAGEMLKHRIEAAVMDAAAGIRDDVLMKLRVFEKKTYRAYPRIWLSRCLEHRFLPLAYRLLTCLLVAENRFGNGQPGETLLCLLAYHPLNKPILAHGSAPEISCRCHGAWLFPARLVLGLLATAAGYLAMGALAAARPAGPSGPAGSGPGRVGVQYCWGHDTSKRSDLYWLEDSGVEPGRVLFYFDRPDQPLTPGIAAALEGLGLSFLRRRSVQADLAPAFLARIFGRKRRLAQGPGPDWRITRRFGIDLFDHFWKSWADFWRTFSFKNVLLQIHLFNDLQDAFILILYWKDFFINNNIKVNINHSGDTGPGHVIQTLAMQGSGGINIRSTYSFLSINSAKYSREFHAYFAWGKMPKCSMDTEMIYSKYALICGYPFTRIFRNTSISPEHKQFVETHRSIAVFDEAYGGSSIFSKDCIVSFYTLLSRLAMSHDDLGLVLKPKDPGRDKIAGMSPECREVLEQGKAYLLEGESPYKACIGATLAVCVGINSAGFEAALFGLPVLFLAVDDTVCPLLERTGSSHGVYHDPQAFLAAIEGVLAGEIDPNRFRLDASVLNAVDPYRDDRAGERTGLFIRDVLAALDAGGDTDQALSAAVAAFSRKGGTVDLPQTFWI